MRITRRTTVPADVETAFGVVATQDFHEAKVAPACTDAGARIEDRGDGGVTVHGYRVVPTRDMPTAVVAAAGESLRITETQTWRPPAADGSRTGEIEMTVDGLPLTMRGRTVLAPAAGGSSLTLEGDLTCGLPIVGRRIEKAAAPVIEGAFDDEAALLTSRVG